MSRLPLPLRAYRSALGLAQPAAAGLLLWRGRKGKEDPARIAERRGRPSRPRPEGPLAWLHGASIGETVSLLPVVERLTRRNLHVLVTSGTRTAAELMTRRLPPGAFHQYVPLDAPAYVRRFLDHWRPDLALFAESEIWPVTVLELEARGTPLVLVNARVSERSFRRWSRFPGVARALFSRLSLCLAQSAPDAERLAALGAARVTVSGNLKFDSAPPPADPRVLSPYLGLVSGRPVWVAASTHPGEETLVLAAHRALAAEFPDLLTILAPRHPPRAEAVAAEADGAGLAVARRSEGAAPERETALYVVDTVGELGLFYRLAPLVFMGGSLVRHGGQNPIEPAKLGAAVLHGPYVHNFAEVYRVLDGSGGALAVADGAHLARALADLLRDGELVREMARAAGEAVAGLGGAVDRTVQAIDPFILQLKLDRR
jgi:3-deoxy-D-manno-octulosonic-acid transferase